MNDFRATFDSLKALLKRYEPPFTVTVDTDSQL